MRRLQQHYRATDSFTADIEQTLTAPGAAPRKRSGTLAWRKPGMIRWEFASPQAELLVADGTTLYDYDPGLNQVLEMPERSAFKNRGIAAVILGVGDLMRDFAIAEPRSGPGTDGLAHLVLTPRGGGPAIEVGLDRDTLNIQMLHTVDALGNSTLLELRNLRRNLPQDPSRFTFVVPSGADIVEAAPSR